MRTLKLCILLTAAFALVPAQQTRTEMPVHPDAANDSKANSASVPDAYAVTGQFEKIVILRLKYQTDLLDGIENLVKTQNIRNAVILSAIGAVRNYRIHDTTSRSFPAQDTVLEDRSSPADIVSMNGYIINGRVHAHMSMANPKGAFGGHIERGTTVFTFAAITVGVFQSGLDLSKIDDKTYR